MQMENMEREIEYTINDKLQFLYLYIKGTGKYNPSELNFNYDVTYRSFFQFHFMPWRQNKLTAS